MALFETIPPEKASGKLAELYTETEQMFGRVPNNVRLLGVSPDILENQLQFVQHYIGHPTLSMPFLAMVRMLVSRGCRSQYCTRLNEGLLRTAGLTPEEIDAALKDPADAPLRDKEKKLLLLVLKAAQTPQAVTAEDLADARAAGWSDVDIFDAVAHAARMVGTNIIFDTFKIDPD